MTTSNGLTTTTGHTPAAERLSFPTKLAFGAGDLGQGMVATIISFLQLLFLTTVAGLNPAAAGTILLIVRLWDAINDLLIGWLSDKTQSRHGRRRSWILYGTIPFVLTFFLLWIVPPFDSTGLFLYYLAVNFLFSIAFTSVSVPYTALTPDMTQDYDERTGSMHFGSPLALAAVWSALCCIKALSSFFAPCSKPVTQPNCVRAMLWRPVHWH